jgi:FAD/FMN-containing dehydrogenase
MANGEVFDGLSTLRKDNTGYDLKQLFIGSEGTLGVITKIAILAPDKPKGTQVAFLALKSYADVLETMKRAKHELSDLLSAIEFADRQSVDRVFHHFADLPNPLADQYPFYMLLELSSNNLEQDSERINSFLMNCIEKEMVLDGTIAQDLGQAQNLWKIREGIPESLSKSGLVFKYDVSVPVSEMYDLVNVLRERLSTKLSFPQDRVTGYGHLGDGNLHLNIWQPRNEDSKSLEQAIEPFVFEEVKKRAGSISAEHGLGLQKAQHIHYSKSATQIKIMKQIKNMFDPNGILNPYKVLPDK